MDATTNNCRFILTEGSGLSVFASWISVRNAQGLTERNTLALLLQNAYGCLKGDNSITLYAPNNS